MRGKKFGAGVAVAAIAVVGGAIAGASIPDSNGVIHSCFAKTGGALRVIDTQNLKTGRCTKDENPLAWNQQGPAGPPAYATLPPAFESQAQFAALGPTDTTVAALTLPAGTYVVWAKGQVRANDSSFDSCDLRRAGVNTDHAEVQTDGIAVGSNNSTMPIVLQSMAGSDGTIAMSLVCRGDVLSRGRPSAPPSIGNVVLIAIQVASTNTSPL